VKTTVRTIVFVLVAGLVAVGGVCALDPEMVGRSRPRNPEIRFDVAEYGETWYLDDMNGDGQIDFAQKNDENGQAILQAMDFNNDGFMDDFYFLNAGSLVRQELDTNFDGAIDLWVYVVDGIYVEGYERDLDHDGFIDVVRDYGNGD
jgi:hypothetical protein